MIDTIRFRIPIDIPTYVMIRDKCDAYIIEPSDENGFKKTVYGKSFKFGSHDAKVRVSISFEDCFYIEFSVPKYWFGHNVLLFPLENLSIVLDDLKNRLEDKFGVKLTDIFDWRIQRLDICYAWKLPSNDDARLALAILKPYQLPRKDQIVYDTTINHKGFSSSTKFYLKYDEFVDNDFKTLKKWGFVDFAEKVKELSVGVFRFEVTMHKAKLDSVFKKDIYYTDILDTVKIHKLLRDHLTEVLKLTNLEVTNLYSTIKLIKTASTPRKAWELLSFWRLYSSVNPMDKEILRLLPKQTFYTKVKQLKEIGVGVFDNNNALNFSYEIPSIYEVHESQIDE